jgi:hypothetical protein
MRIDPTGLTPTSPSSSEKTSAAGTSSANGSSSTSRTGGADILPLPLQSGYLPSTELSDLTNRAKSDPEVRADRIRDVAHKLHHGHYGTPLSNAKTASAILGAQD